MFFEVGQPLDEGATTAAPMTKEEIEKLLVVLRPATNDDRAAIERLVFTVLAEHGLKPNPSGTSADLHDIQASYFAGGGAFDLLVDGSGQVIRSVGLCRVSDSTCELRKMYLAPEVRGCGWGRRLLEHALARRTAHSSAARARGSLTGT